MSQSNLDEALYEEARKRVKKKKGFYGHLSAFIAVGLFFFIMNMSTSPNELWFPFPMMGWGIGLVIHYFSVFGIPGMKGALTEEWEDRETANEMKKLVNRYKPIVDEEIDNHLELKEIQKEKTAQKRWSDEDLV